MLLTAVPSHDHSVLIENAWTPPAAWYRDPDHFAREKREVFALAWQPAARADQLDLPGDFVASDLNGEPVLVLRGEDDEPRAFRNICRHHGAELARGCGHARALTCPYHGWRYSLDGSLLKAPRMAGVQHFDREAMGLYRLPIQRFGPLYFVNAHPTPSAFTPLRAALERWLDSEDLEGLRFVTRREYEIACNWKVYVENYLDGGYHVPLLHPALAEKLDIESYRTEVEGPASAQLCLGRGGDARLGREAIYLFVEPNLMLNRYGPWLDSNLVVPLGPERCRVIFEWYIEPRAGRDEAYVADALEQSEQVQREDIEICESVQRGVRSRAWRGGRYAPAVEIAMHHFHRRLAAQLDI